MPLRSPAGSTGAPERRQQLRRVGSPLPPINAHRSPSPAASSQQGEASVVRRVQQHAPPQRQLVYQALPSQHHRLRHLRRSVRPREQAGVRSHYTVIPAESLMSCLLKIKGSLGEEKETKEQVAAIMTRVEGLIEDLLPTYPREIELMEMDRTAIVTPDKKYVRVRKVQVRDILEEEDIVYQSGTAGYAHQAGDKDSDSGDSLDSATEALDSQVSQAVLAANRRQRERDLRRSGANALLAVALTPASARTVQPRASIRERSSSGYEPTPRRVNSRPSSRSSVRSEGTSSAGSDWDTYGDLMGVVGDGAFLDADSAMEDEEDANEPVAGVDGDEKSSELLDKLAQAILEVKYLVLSQPDLSHLSFEKVRKATKKMARSRLDLLAMLRRSHKLLTLAHSQVTQLEQELTELKHSFLSRRQSSKWNVSGSMAPDSKRQSTNSLVTFGRVTSYVSAPGVGSKTLRKLRVPMEAQAYQREIRRNLHETAPAGEVTLVCTSVAGALELWQWDPEQMKLALAVHNQVIRDAARMTKGYEVRVEGDRFLLAFPTPLDAVRFCIRAQLQLVSADWPATLLQHPLCVPTRADRPSGYNKGGGGESQQSVPIIWRGLRVRMGLHWGHAVLDRDPITKRAEYLGSALHVTARLGSMARGGEIVCSLNTFNEVKHHLGILEGGVEPKPLGPVKVVALPGRMQLFQLLPKQLSQRHPAEDRHPAPELLTLHPWLPTFLDWVGSRMNGNARNQDFISRTQKGLQQTSLSADVKAPEGAEVTVVVCSVANSVALWNWNADVTHRAIVTFYETVRSVAPTHLAYESSLDADTGHLTFPSATKAVQFACALQERLLGMNWPLELEEYPETRLETDTRVRNDDGSDRYLWRGLRVRIGVYHGNIVREELRSGRFVYTGTAVNRAENCCDLACGGQIVLPKSVYEKVHRNCSDLHYCFAKLGTHTLPSAGAQEELWHVLPRSLESRMAPLLAQRPETPAPLSSLWKTVQQQFKAEQGTLGKAQRRIEEDLQRGQQLASKQVAPSGHLTIVFTEIENATALWEASTEGMVQAVLQLSEMMRDQLSFYQGYESRCECDAFMFAFQRESEALCFCLKVQELLHHVEWPSAILNLPDAREVRDPATGALLWKGPRVKMGIHSGKPFSAKEQAVDFYGPVVCTALQACTLAGGGQIVITARVYSSIHNKLSLLGTPLLTEVGEFPMLSNPDPVMLYGLVPKNFAAREFPKRQTDKSVSSANAMLAWWATEDEFNLVTQMIGRDLSSEEEDSEEETSSMKDRHQRINQLLRSPPAFKSMSDLIEAVKLDADSFIDSTAEKAERFEQRLPDYSGDPGGMKLLTAQQKMVMKSVQKFEKLCKALEKMSGDIEFLAELKVPPCPECGHVADRDATVAHAKPSSGGTVHNSVDPAEKKDPSKRKGLTSSENRNASEVDERHEDYGPREGSEEESNEDSSDGELYEEEEYDEEEEEENEEEDDPDIRAESNTEEPKRRAVQTEGTQAFKFGDAPEAAPESSRTKDSRVENSGKSRRASSSSTKAKKKRVPKVRRKSVPSVATTNTNSSRRTSSKASGGRRRSNRHQHAAPRSSSQAYHSLVAPHGSTRFALILLQRVERDRMFIEDKYERSRLMISRPEKLVRGRPAMQLWRDTFQKIRERYLRELNMGRMRAEDDLKAAQKVVQEQQTAVYQLHRHVRFFLGLMKGYLASFESSEKMFLTEDDFIAAWMKFYRELLEEGQEKPKATGKKPPPRRNPRHDFKEMIMATIDGDAEETSHQQDFRRLAASIPGQLGKYYNFVKSLLRRLGIHRDHGASRWGQGWGRTGKAFKDGPGGSVGGRRSTGQNNLRRPDTREDSTQGGNVAGSNGTPPETPGGVESDTNAGNTTGSESTAEASNNRRRTPPSGRTRRTTTPPSPGPKNARRSTRSSTTRPAVPVTPEPAEPEETRATTLTASASGVSLSVSNPQLPSSILRVSGDVPSASQSLDHTADNKRKVSFLPPAT